MAHTIYSFRRLTFSLPNLAECLLNGRLCYMQKHENLAMLTNRNQSMDMLRIICAIFIVFIHVTPEYNPAVAGSLPSLFIHSLVRSGLPIFFIMSGYFILNSKINSLVDFYKSRLVTIIVPFLVFSFAHYCYFHQWDPNAYSSEWAVNYLKSVMYGSPVNFGRQYFMTGLYWFVYAIIGLYIITPVIIKCMEFIGNENALKCLMVLLAFYCVTQVSGAYLKTINFSEDWMQYPDGLKWVLYFIIGGIIKRVEKNINSLAISFAVIISYFLVVITYHGSATGKWYSLGWIDANAAMVLLSTSIFILFHTQKIKLQSKIIPYLSSLTYGVYLIHIVWLSVVNEKTNVISNELITYTLSTGLLVVFFAFMTSSIVNFFIIKRIVGLLK